MKVDQGSPPHPSSPLHRHFSAMLATYSDSNAGAMADIKSTAQSLISSGSSKECESIYKAARKAYVDDALKNMGFVAMSGQQLHRLEWEQLDHRVKVWLAAAGHAFGTVFPAERSLADDVFQPDQAIADSCYAHATGDAAAALLAFPELVSGKCKRSPERMFRFLDMYDFVAACGPSAAVTLVKLGEAVREMLTQFDSAIQHDAAKTAVPGGGLHPATRYVMNYVALLADYAGSLKTILAGLPLPVPPATLISDGSDVSLRLSWIILVLLCKIDSKAELYSDVGLSYLFLCNNLHYVVGKVRSAANLRRLLGEEWLTKHEEKRRTYAGSYERIVWGPAVEAVKEEALMRFSEEFERACRRQAGWVVPDSKLRDEIKISAERAVIRPYGEVYRRRRAVAMARYSPEDLGNYMSDLFMEDAGGVWPARGID